MTTDQFISMLEKADFDTIAQEAVMSVDDAYFRQKYIQAFEESETMKGQSIHEKYIPWWSVKGYTLKKYPYRRIYAGHYDTLNITGEFRSNIHLEGVDNGSIEVHSNADYDGIEYGSKVEANLHNHGVEVFEWDNDEESKELFTTNFINELLK